jgi:predicted 3-demethylubiquinone-9 3-methyltransferase (glyoxalase superfamily)
MVRQETIMQKITTFLWFNDSAEEAVKFYTSIFKNSRIARISYYPAAAAKSSGQPARSVMTIAFKLNGQEFIALNGGPNFEFTEAVSLMVHCDTQAELDRYWRKLTSGGGKEVQCGWLKDKYGLFWQIVPAFLIKLISDKDAAKADRVMQVVMNSVKLDFKKLKAAAKQK